MRAIFLEGNDVAVREDAPSPTLAEGEVLVRVLQAGICETDFQLMRGYMGFRGVLGHEFVGIAESGAFAGRRVVGEINCSCWTCETCRAGRPTHCPHRSVIGILNHDGAFADSVAVPQRNLHVVPDSVSDDLAVFTEPLAAAFQIPTQLRLRREDRVIVLGDGRLGNLSAQVLARQCEHVLIIGKHDSKLALLNELGLRTCRLDECSQDRQADVVVDCTGSESGLPLALKLVRPRGTIVLKTTVAGTQTLAWAPIVIDEVTIVGSRCGPFGRALVALEQGEVQVQPLISDRFPLADGLAALKRAQEPGVLKVLLDFERD